jgi:hypothetical protein
MASFDGEGYSRVWRDRSGRFVRVLGDARYTLARSVEKLSKNKMQQEIYAIPEDVGPGGQKKWVRTGNLLNAEQAEVRGPGEVVLTNAMVYAHARHELGRDGRQTKREAHWRDDIREGARELQLATYQAAVAEALRET